MKQNIVIVGCVALLIISTCFLPAINSQVVTIEKTKKNIKHNTETVDVIICQYNGEGITTEIKKKISVSLAKEISSKLRKTKNIEEKLYLLKKYDLLSDIPSIEKMREKANKIAERYNLFDKRLIKTIKSLENGGRIKVCISRIVDVEGSSVIGYFPVGLSAVTGFINGILLLLAMLTNGVFIPIPSVDLLVGMYAGESSSPKIADGHILLGIGLFPWTRYFEGGAGSWFISFGFVGIAVYFGIPPGFSSIYADIIGFVPFAVAYLAPFQ
jgi:hypothetical protein